MAEREGLSPEELLEQIRRMKVSDLLVSTIATVAQLGYAKLDAADRDLEQAKLAIDSLDALIPVLDDAVPEQDVTQFRQLTSDLKLAYAGAADEELRASPENGAERESDG